MKPEPPDENKLHPIKGLASHFLLWSGFWPWPRLLKELPLGKLEPLLISPMRTIKIVISPE
jgi:hypothetical protein